MEISARGGRVHKVSIEVKRMLPEEEEKPEPEKMQEIQDDKSKATMDRLDAAARTLVTATTVLIALLAALGLTADRLTVLLNSSASKNLVIVAVLCAAAAVICGTVAVALSVDHVKWEQRAV